MPGQINNPGGLGILAAGAIPRYRLVKGNGALCAGDATRDWVGVSQDAAATGATIPLRLTKAGTCIMTAAVAITANTVVFKDANGMVGLTGANARVGIALEAASAINAEIEVLPD